MCVFRRFLKMGKDSAARIELGRSFHQMGTVNEKVCESEMLWLESLPGQENMIILLQFYSLCTGYLLSSVSVTKYYYLPIRP